MFLNVLDCDKILVVAPHPDDETIGCGGLLAKYRNQCDILVLTDGRKGYKSGMDINEDELAEERKNEVLSVANIVGANKVINLDIVDGTVAQNLDKIYSVDITSYKYIFVPNHLERHKDHCVVASAFVKMQKQQKAKSELFEYEVWSPITTPSHILDISDVIDIKRKMIEQHKTQTQFVDYTEMSMALSRYRGAGFNCKFAEVYRWLPRKTLAKKLYHKVPVSVRKGVKKIIKKVK